MDPFRRGDADRLYNELLQQVQQQMIHYRENTNNKLSMIEEMIESLVQKVNVDSIDKCEKEQEEFVNPFGRKANVRQDRTVQPGFIPDSLHHLELRLPKFEGAEVIKCSPDSEHQEFIGKPIYDEAPEEGQECWPEKEFILAALNGRNPNSSKLLQPEICTGERPEASEDLSYTQVIQDRTTHSPLQRLQPIRLEEVYSITPTSRETFEAFLSKRIVKDFLTALIPHNLSIKSGEFGNGNILIFDPGGQMKNEQSKVSGPISDSWGGSSGKRENSVNAAKMLAGRECSYSGKGRFSAADRCHVLNKYLPKSSPSVIDEMTTRAYVSQFSADGSLCVVAFQGSHIRIYSVDRGWKVHKNILAKSLRWTVTDTSFSPDQQHLVYATMSPIVHIVNITSGATDSQANITEIHDGLEFSREDDGGYSFGIFSVKFSTDGRELVAGSSDDAIYVYDLAANKLSLRIDAHTSDVNSVSFADESGNLIYSGSDDNLCKVWDRRCFKPKGKPAGVLMGHLEGVTYLDSRGDGRYLISNGKDQTIKLWDIRRMSSSSNCQPIFRKYEWDYRWMEYPHQARNLKHPNDQSVATYKGHSVLRTLIRCYFSPTHSTGQKYIYTGSHDSCIYIYDVVSGTQVAKLKHHKSTVRDCSWHPDYPMLVSSAWDGDVVKWEFPGNEKAPAPSNKGRIHRR